MKAKRGTASVERGTASDDIVEVLRRGRGDPRRCKPALTRLIERTHSDGGSLFLFDDDGVSLCGAHGIWDWTRTSFRVRIDLWPSVEKSLRAGRAVSITASSAQGLEADWFEPGGISSCICAPQIVGGRRVGVLFLDYFLRRKPAAPTELALAASVAASWGEILIAERRAALASGIRELRAVVGNCLGSPANDAVAAPYETLGGSG